MQGLRDVLISVATILFCILIIQPKLHQMCLLFKVLMDSFHSVELFNMHESAPIVHAPVCAPENGNQPPHFSKLNLVVVMDFELFCLISSCY